jgi:hypothetical protein
MHLDPDSYTCAEHGHDLTSAVREALEEEPLPLAYPTARLLGSRIVKEGFEVVVSCPGGSPGGAHEVAFDGTFWR